jgi:hypothetical protein
MLKDRGSSKQQTKLLSSCPLNTHWVIQRIQIKTVTWGKENIGNDTQS